MARILSVGTAVPQYVFRQDEVRQVVRKRFASAFRDIDRLLPVFEHASIDTRYFCVPMDWYGADHSFAEKNRLYVENAISLSVEAIKKCLQKAKVVPQDIDCILFVSTTGLSTPSIDAHIANILEMKPSIRRLPLWGLGCAGGTAGLARGAELARAYPGSLVLVVSVELCGLTFLGGDLSKSNLIATSLFGDGAAALLLTTEPNDPLSPPQGTSNGLPRLIASQSTLWPDTVDIMGWELTDAGLKVIFSRDIPSFVQKWIPDAVDSFLAAQQLTRNDITRIIPHPGGMKVIQAYEESLRIKSELTYHAREVLRNYGNMSSATVLFVLEKTIADKVGEGEYGLMTALGPGFSSELVLLQW
ncbi:type III polyketide synthase [Heliobacterium chlorum]|uniref:Type III polyketide synthase n=1 Tax=Heliobacterium chlorum TaxID=2698 RepID=A0ABR7SWM9_HELCL|nr:3-oxoacyl-[acyl-carrier-protein] synthase III C-terminal domain-containing protein [Heliobacterium chlorum]MBC9782953.1 type III polyketide synthase [Heliobacterium chlorum]